MVQVGDKIEIRTIRRDLHHWAFNHISPFKVIKVDTEPLDNWVEYICYVNDCEYPIYPNDIKEVIKENKEYGHVICRCEVVSEAEIRDAIRRVPGAKDLDGIKRRLRAGMGRCQMGFCTPMVMKILSEELNIPLDEITKKGNDSYLLIGDKNNDEC